MSIFVKYTMSTTSAFDVEIHEGTVLEPKKFSFTQYPQFLYETVEMGNDRSSSACDLCAFSSQIENYRRQMCYSSPECLPNSIVKIYGLAGAFGNTPNKSVYYREYIPNPVNRIDVTEVDI